MAIQDGPNDKYLSISRQKHFFIADQHINDISYCLQSNNCQLSYMQHHGKVTSFPSWILPMLSWFYVQDRYLSCPKAIVGRSFHPQEAIDTRKCMFIANSRTDKQHVVLERQCQIHCITLYVLYVDEFQRQIHFWLMKSRVRPPYSCTALHWIVHYEQKSRFIEPGWSIP